MGKPLLVEEFGAEQNRQAVFGAVSEAVEASLKSGGPLKGALFWQYKADGQVRHCRWRRRACGTQPPAASPHAPEYRHRAAHATRRMQTASKGEGGGAGRFGVLAGDAAFSQVKANAAAVASLYSRPASPCTPQGLPTAGACADNGCVRISL